MTARAESHQLLRDMTEKVARLVHRRQRLQAAGEDLSGVDRQLLSYKTLYVQAGAIYGGNSAGMVRWFAERGLDDEPVAGLNDEGIPVEDAATTRLPAADATPGYVPGTI